MSGPLSLEERAKRNATRLNNKTKKRFPLFADQFATTPEEQQARLQRLDGVSDRFMDRLKEGSRHQWQKGTERREALSAIIPSDDLAKCDAKWEFVFGADGMSPKTPDCGGEYYADHWWQCAKKYAPEWAQAHCPNACIHEEDVYRRKGKCPTCGLSLMPPENVAVEVVQAVLFG